MGDFIDERVGYMLTIRRYSDREKIIINVLGTLHIAQFVNTVEGKGMG